MQKKVDKNDICVTKCTICAKFSFFWVDIFKKAKNRVIIVALT